MFWKTFEEIILECLFGYLDEQKIMSEHKSGFWPNDSCTYHLLSNIHDLYTAFDADPTLEVRGVFLNMSKSFDEM